MLQKGRREGRSLAQGGSNLSALIGQPQLPQNASSTPSRSFTFNPSDQVLQFPPHTLSPLSSASNGFQILPRRPADWPPALPADPQDPIQTLLGWSATLQRLPCRGTSQALLWLTRIWRHVGYYLACQLRVKKPYLLRGRHC